MKTETAASLKMARRSRPAVGGAGVDREALSEHTGHPEAAANWDYYSLFLFKRQYAPSMFSK